MTLQVKLLILLIYVKYNCKYNNKTLFSDRSADLSNLLNGKINNKNN